MTTREFAHLQQDNAEIERSVLSQEVEVLRNRLNLRQVDVSKECGVNASMLSQWMLGRYKGNVARINGLMEAWLIRRRGGKPMDKNLLMMASSSSFPKYKRGIEEVDDGSKIHTSKTSVLLSHRKLYKYPAMAPSNMFLIPIHLDVDYEGYRYIDSFSWNLYESDFTYETFAAALVRDLDLPECLYQRIAQSIEKHVEDAKKLHTGYPWVSDTTIQHEPLHPIFINIRINDTILFDRFEWDISDPRNSPENFAQVLCGELGLSGAFETQVALSIREQIINYAKYYQDGKSEQLTRLPRLLPSTVFRDISDSKQWAPSVKYILADDIPQLEREDYKRMRSMTHSTQPATTSNMLPLKKKYNTTPRSGQYALTPQSSPKNSLKDKERRPPKPVNTFLMFCRQWRKQIMSLNANTSAKDTSKLLGEMWQKLTDEQRASYIPMTAKENARRLKEWQAKEQCRDAQASNAVNTAQQIIDANSSQVATSSASTFASSQTSNTGIDNISAGITLGMAGPMNGVMAASPASSLLEDVMGDGGADDDDDDIDEEEDEDNDGEDGEEDEDEDEDEDDDEDNEVDDEDEL